MRKCSHYGLAEIRGKDARAGVVTLIRGKGDRGIDQALAGFLAFAAFLALTDSLRTEPGLKEGTFAALILIGSPFLGLRPVRAALSLTLKDPNPRMETSSPFANAPAIC